jgi:hypothetical protein
MVFVSAERVLRRPTLEAFLCSSATLTEQPDSWESSGRHMRHQDGDETHRSGGQFHPGGNVPRRLTVVAIRVKSLHRERAK